jgi:ribosomal protein L24
MTEPAGNLDEVVFKPEVVIEPDMIVDIMAGQHAGNRGTVLKVLPRTVRVQLFGVPFSRKGVLVRKTSVKVRPDPAVTLRYCLLSELAIRLSEMARQLSARQLARKTRGPH